MAFPTVATTAYSEETADTTTHDVTVPASIASGDLLMLFIVIDAFTADVPTLSGLTGWTQLFRTVQASEQHVLEVYYKFASGSETNFTYTSSLSKKSTNLCWRITGAHASTPPEASTATNGTGTTSSPPDLDPAGWGTEDTLWIAFVGITANQTITGYPTNTPDNQSTDTTAGGGAGVTYGIATANSATANLNVASFTFSASDSHASRSMAVRPAAAAAATSIDPMGMMGFFGA